MKKRIFCLLIACAMLLGLSPCSVTVFAATDEPVIIMQPQSPNYPEYSVAIYTVKAEGENLRATWYLEWQGKTYTASEIGSAMQPWEAYAGEGFGARKLDDNTFAFLFEGIGKELDGAYIWCMLEDGHYDLTSQKTRITVGGEATPPEILSIPSSLAVEVGDEAELRCVAKSADGSQLSFLWYESDTGRLEDIRAVDRGAEDADFLICNTESIGTRNYLCCVRSANGGTVYSGFVPVTVTEKKLVTAPEETPSDEAPPETTTTVAEESEKAQAPSESVTPTSAAEEKSESGVSTGTVILIAAVAVVFGVLIGAIFLKGKKK